MFWGIKLQLTEEGQIPGRLEGLLGAVHDALAVGGGLMGDGLRTAWTAQLHA